MFFGILMVVVFLLSGQFMDKYHNHLQDMELMARALYRAGHIYILLFGLINAALGAHLKLSDIKWINILQKAGSGILFLASFMVIFSFFTELPATEIERSFARISLYLILLGVSIHGLTTLIPTKRIQKR